jgi:hypothetical protein
MVSYQREEERYWTDYLRIALPIVGLLLMLGLFWFWASSLIDGDDDNGSTTPTALAEIITPPTPSPTVQEAANLEATQTTRTTDETAPTPTEGSEQAPPAETESTAPEEEPTTPPENSAGDGFAEGDTVVVNDDEVNMRSAPTTQEENVVAVLSEGTELVVTGAPEEAEGYIWYPVRNDVTGDEGYIADELLRSS